MFHSYVSSCSCSSFLFPKWFLFAVVFGQTVLLLSGHFLEMITASFLFVFEISAKNVLYLGGNAIRGSGNITSISFHSPFCFCFSSIRVKTAFLFISGADWISFSSNKQRERSVMEGEELRRNGLSAVGLIEDGASNILHCAALMPCLTLCFSETDFFFLLYSVPLLLANKSASIRALSAFFQRRSNKPLFFSTTFNHYQVPKKRPAPNNMSLSEEGFSQNENLLSRPESFVCKPKSLSR